ncbi:papain-like cysteine protease family protein [Legionella gresilensis]|uniref:papain-like cysteine protease family protein n=1 Tax=Legionella gresilensis TaxID=91823 RepID=UPI00104124E7|nr:papain-like cysteine protease family protein [Legionella gresilensis]
MLIFKSPLVEQSIVDEKQKVKAINSCWLYAPSIVRCNSEKEEEFEAQKEFLLKQMLESGISPDTLNNMLLKGAPPTTDFYDNQSKILNLTKTVSLSDITGTFEDYRETTNKEKRLIYQELHSLLEKNGPLILEYPAFGFEAIHRTAITGIILVKNSKKDLEEICLILNDTMEGRLKALSVADFLENETVKEGVSRFFIPAEERQEMPERYLTPEIVVMMGTFSSHPGHANLKTDILVLHMDSFIDFNAKAVINFIGDESLNPNQFFKGSITAKESAKSSKIDNKNSKGNCTVI